MTGLRIASFPATHPYVEAVRPSEVRPVSPGVVDAAQPWAPHPWWEPAQLRQHVADMDVAHVHFGYDHLSPPQLADWTAQLRASGVPLVLTVHDLRNPHHDTPGLHTRQLRVLLESAAEVVTLTPGAAAVIGCWRRAATVLPHPALLDPPAAASRSGWSRRVGVHLKSLRRNVIEPDHIIAATARGVQAAGGELVVDVHPDVVDRPELVGVRRCAAEGRLELRVHERFDDADLVRYLQGLDVSVLPHRFGTHSGWLELCRDLGTRVVAPDCGFYAEQWPAVHLYGNHEQRGLDEASLSGAVAAALTAGPVTVADPRERVAERDAVRRAHLELYQRAAAAGR